MTNFCVKTSSTQVGVKTSCSKVGSYDRSLCQDVE
jgi:hypothetical protein